MGSKTKIRPGSEGGGAKLKLDKEESAGKDSAIYQRYEYKPRKCIV